MKKFVMRCGFIISMLTTSSSLFAVRLDEFFLGLLFLPLMSQPFPIDTLTDHPELSNLFARNNSFLTCWSGYDESDADKNGIWCHDLKCKVTNDRCSLIEPSTLEQRVADLASANKIFLDCQKDSCKAYTANRRHPFSQEIEIRSSTFTPGEPTSLKKQKWSIFSDDRPNIIFTAKGPQVIYTQADRLMVAALNPNGKVEGKKLISDDIYPANVELNFLESAIAGDDLFKFAVAYVGNEDHNSLGLNIYVVIVDHDDSISQLEIQSVYPKSYVHPNYPRLALIEGGLVVVYQKNFNAQPRLFAQRVTKENGAWQKLNQPIQLGQKQGPYYQIASNKKNLLGIVKQRSSFGPGSLSVFDLARNGKVVFGPLAMGPIADLGQILIGQDKQLVRVRTEWNQAKKHSTLKVDSRYLPSKRAPKTGKKKGR